MESAGMNQPALRYRTIAGCAFSTALALATLGGCSDLSGVSGQGAVTRPLIVQDNMEAVTPADFETVTKRDVWIPLRDGTRLLADITLPVGDGPWPTILRVCGHDCARHPISGIQGGCGDL